MSRFTIENPINTDQIKYTSKNAGDCSILYSISQSMSSVIPFGSVSPYDCCHQTGTIECNENGRVNHLDLAFMGLTGAMPIELGSLTGLESLTISNNPKLIGNIVNLRSLKYLHTLDVSMTGISGSVGSSLLPPNLLSCEFGVNQGMCLSNQLSCKGASALNACVASSNNRLNETTTKILLDQPIQPVDNNYTNNGSKGFWLDNQRIIIICGCVFVILIILIIFIVFYCIKRKPKIENKPSFFIPQRKTNGKKFSLFTAAKFSTSKREESIVKPSELGQKQAAAFIEMNGSIVFPVVLPFSGSMTDEISLKPGQNVVLVCVFSDGWAEGLVDDRQGVFPLEAIGMTIKEL